MKSYSEPGRIHGGQGLLFPENGFQLCEKIGLNHWAAAKLHENGWLRFHIEMAGRFSEAIYSRVEPIKKHFNRKPAKS